MSQSARVQHYIGENARATMSAHALSPFTVYLRPNDTREGANFAMPDHPVTEEVGGAMCRIEQLCAAHECKAQVRFLHAFAPTLPSVLQAAGYVEAGNWAILLCTPESHRAAEQVAGLEMVTVARDSPLASVKESLDANALGYDPQAALTTDADAEMFRQNLQQSLAFTARLEGQAVGAGMFNPIYEGVTELVGITTLADFRRRGIASALTSFATHAAFAHGAEMVFLIPEHAQARRIYERLGYRFLTNMLVYQAKTDFPSR